MEKEKGMQFLADIRKSKRDLKEGVSKLINDFEKMRDVKVIELRYELEHKGLKLPDLGKFPIKPGEINIKLEDI